MAQSKLNLKKILEFIGLTEANDEEQNVSRVSRVNNTAYEEERFTPARKTPAPAALPSAWNFWSRSGWGIWGWDSRSTRSQAEKISVSNSPAFWWTRWETPPVARVSC